MKKHRETSKTPKNESRDAGKPGLAADKRREKTMDRTLAESYPASDPPSSIPDPSDEEDDGS